MSGCIRPYRDGGCIGCVAVLIHHGLTLPHLCLALIYNGLILGFACRVVRCMVDCIVDVATDGLANTVDAFQARLDIVDCGVG